MLCGDCPHLKILATPLPYSPPSYRMVPVSIAKFKHGKMSSFLLNLLFHPPVAPRLHHKVIKGENALELLKKAIDAVVKLGGIGRDRKSISSEYFNS